LIVETMRYLLLVPLFFVLSSHTAHAQKRHRKIEKIKLLYEQDNFKKSLKISEKLIEKTEYKRWGTPYLIQSLSIYQLSTEAPASKKNRHALRNSLMAYEQYFQRDKKGAAAKSYANDVLELKTVWQSERNRLIAAGETEEARYYARCLANFFGDTTASHEALFPDGFEEPLPDNEAAESMPVLAVRDNLVLEAKKHIGTPYSYGGTTVRGFDCSGFTGYTFRKLGYDLPRQSDAQATTGKKIPLSKAQKGDLIFFGKGKKISHVALVISERGEPLTVIHATSSKGVMISNIETSTYWKAKVLYAMNVVDNYSAD